MSKIDQCNCTTFLFLGDAWLAECEGITFAIHPPRAEGVVLTPEREWEAYRITPRTVVEDEGHFKMWYACVARHRGQPQPLSCPRCQLENPGSKVVCISCGWPLVDVDYLQTEMTGVAYAESSDGITWERPDLGLVEFRGSRKNNLVAGPCGVPALNPKGGKDERYMAIVEWQRQLYVAVSSDGLTWRRKPEPCLPFSADTTNQLLYDPETDKYVALLRGFPGRRTTVSCEFDRLNQAPWPFDEKGHLPDHTGCRYITDELPTALDVDEADPALPGLDINHISACCYGKNTWLGFPALYRKYPPAGLDRQGRENHRFFTQGNDGTWETQVAVSRDGRRWSRPDRTAYLPPGFFGSPDGGINSLSAGMLQRGNATYLYGGAQSVTHGIFEPDEQRGVGAIYRYSLPRNRFLAAAAGPCGGRLVTHPLSLSGAKLTLNIDCGGLGEASVELQAPDGTPLPGFTHDDCDRLDLNHLECEPTWRGVSTLKISCAREIRVEVRLRSARLYALTVLAP